MSNFNFNINISADDFYTMHDKLKRADEAFFRIRELLAEDEASATSFGGVTRADLNDILIHAGYRPVPDTSIRLMN